MSDEQQAEQQAEQVAHAMADSEAATFGVTDWERSPEWRRDEYRRLARVAIATLRPGQAEEALDRVRALLYPGREGHVRQVELRAALDGTS